MAAGDPFGTVPPRAPRRWRALLPTVLIPIAAVALLALVAAGPGGPAGRLHLGGLRRLVTEASDSCAAKGISTPVGHEGSCIRVSDSGAEREYRVVDRAHTLTMPGYEVRLGGERIVPTTVSRPRDESLYPDGRGLLVSLWLTVTDSGPAPLRLLGSTGSGRRPRYPARTTIELSVPEAASDGPLVGFPAIVEPVGGPPGTLPAAIAPGASASGWVSFVCSDATARTMRLRPADLDFYGRDHGVAVVGQVRLWK